MNKQSKNILFAFLAVVAVIIYFVTSEKGLAIFIFGMLIACFIVSAFSEISFVKVKSYSRVKKPKKKTIDKSVTVLIIAYPHSYFGHYDFARNRWMIKEHFASNLLSDDKNAFVWQYIPKRAIDEQHIEV